LNAVSQINLHRLDIILLEFRLIESSH